MLYVKALKCYECHEIDQPEHCNGTVTCPTNDHVGKLEL